MRNKKVLTTLVATAVALLTVLPASHSQAAAQKCVPVKAKGKVIGKVMYAKVNMPIISFLYPEGGVMEPQKSTLMVGLSGRHMPLSSTVGTSVLVWHVNYNYCWNPMNFITQQKAGYVFKLVDEKGATHKYAISRKYVVNKGDYEESWFDLVGPRKILLVTCTGEFKHGHYTQNTVLIAKPV